MPKQIQNIAVNTDYVEGEGQPTIVLRLIEAAVNMLPSDYDRLRVLNYSVQKIVDGRNTQMEDQTKAQMQEVPHGPAR